MAQSATQSNLNSGSFFDPPASSQNFWNVLASEFNLPEETTENIAVRRAIKWYIKNPAYLTKIAEQAKPYLYYIYQQVKKRHLPAEIVLLPMVESNYNPFVCSSVGACGLWQMMPGTALGFGLKEDWWYDGRRDIAASTNSALNYLVYLGKFFHGDWLLAIAAYDTGEGSVSHAMHRNLSLGEPIDFWHLWLPRETQNYVPKLLALATIIKYPYEFGVRLPAVKNKPYLEKVNIGSQIDLSRAARLAGISMKELTHLNPGYNRWATDTHGPHFLLLPIDKAQIFKKRLAKIPKKDRVNWIRHKVKRGDSLSVVAHRYKTTPSMIKRVNRLKSNLIHVGKILLVPKSQSKMTRIVERFKSHYLKGHKHRIHLSTIKHYIVKKGDSLWHIARKFRVKIRQLRFWNKLKKGHQLHAGQKLSIWPNRVPKHHVSRPVHHHTTHHHVKSSKKHHRVIHHHVKHHTVRRLNYRVRKGDTLSGVAQKYHVHVHDIQRWNNISNAAHLKQNQMLVIYR